MNPGSLEAAAIAIYQHRGGIHPSEYMEVIGVPRPNWESLPEHERDEYRLQARKAFDVFLKDRLDAIAARDASDEMPECCNKIMNDLYNAFTNFGRDYAEKELGGRTPENLRQRVALQQAFNAGRASSIDDALKLRSKSDA